MIWLLSGMSTLGQLDDQRLWVTVNPLTAATVREPSGTGEVSAEQLMASLSSGRETSRCNASVAAQRSRR